MYIDNQQVCTLPSDSSLKASGTDNSYSALHNPNFSAEGKQHAQEKLEHVEHQYPDAYQQDDKSSAHVAAGLKGLVTSQSHGGARMGV